MAEKDNRKGTVSGKEEAPKETTLHKVKDSFDFFQTLINLIAVVAGVAGFEGIRKRLKGTENADGGDHDTTTAGGADKPEEQAYLFLDASFGKPPRDQKALLDYQLTPPTPTEFAVFTSFLHDILTPDQAYVIWSAINRKDSTVRIPEVQEFTTFNPKAGKDVTIRQLHEIAITINVKGGVIMKQFARHILEKTEAGTDPTPEEQRARMEKIRDVMVHSKGLPPAKSKADEAKEIALDEFKKAETKIHRFSARRLIGRKAVRNIEESDKVRDLDQRIAAEQDGAKRRRLEEERQALLVSLGLSHWEKYRLCYTLKRVLIALVLGVIVLYFLTDMMNMLKNA